jgi:hypothetical protein
LKDEKSSDNIKAEKNLYEHFPHFRPYLPYNVSIRPLSHPQFQCHGIASSEANFEK